MANHQPELEVELTQYLRTLVPASDVLCETVDRGERGLLITMPNGRIITLTAAAPSRAFIERIIPPDQQK